jgi:hypothetical protein
VTPATTEADLAGSTAPVASLASSTRTTVSSTPTPEPASFGADPTPVPVAVPASKRLRWWQGAAAAAVLLAAAFGLRAWTARAPSRPAAVPAAPTPATLVIDALPWGEVERIVDDEGRSVGLGADRYTPFVASLPPGDYAVSVRNPEQARAETFEVRLRAAQVEKRVVAFERIDADEYLSKAGY